MGPTHPLLDRLLARGRRHRPVIGAHRGASARAPENTLAAFRAALDDEAELIELDVHLTRDGRLAVIHDEETRRITSTAGVVAELSMSELRRLDAGRHKGQQWAGEQIPELGDVFAAVRGRLLVNVEVKCSAAAVPALARCMAEHDMADAVIVSSFDPAVVHAVGVCNTSLLCPSLLAGLLVDRPVPDPVTAAREGGAQLLHVKHTYLTVALVDLLHQAGLGALAWTVNAPGEMRRLAALGVDAILSDDPRRLRTVVG
ncbi:MAG TPA: glycerophosphodiester phosphodiesterase family protein [Chloroflexota bacterium]|nr:glycerophosphodiester phosphodiesterase family protein [Chloroflexota bacterium]